MKGRAVIGLLIATLFLAAVYWALSRKRPEGQLVRLTGDRQYERPRATPKSVGARFYFKADKF